jgi:hypothetical protein
MKYRSRGNHWIYIELIGLKRTTMSCMHFRSNTKCRIFCFNVDRTLLYVTTLIPLALLDKYVPTKTVYLLSVLKQ